MNYWYCSIKVKGMAASYSYISDEGELPVGTYVKVPFGKENTERIGEVVACGSYDEEAVPFPVEKTKRIIRTATEEEYESSEAVRPLGQSRDYYDIEEVNRCIKEEDWDEVLDWAIEHSEIENPAIVDKVIECYRLCAENNMPEAALNLGTYYYNGVYLKQDFKEAYRLYKIAADAGDLRAICNCGYCFYYGRHQAVDYKEAYHWFSLGALLFGDPNCLYKLGDMYLDGKYVGNNSLYAYMLYNRALNRCRDRDTGSFCIPDICLRMGKCCLRGIGTGINTMKAHTLLSEALDGFYRRRKTDPFVGGLIEEARQLLCECEEILNSELI